MRLTSASSARGCRKSPLARLAYDLLNGALFRYAELAAAPTRGEDLVMDSNSEPRPAEAKVIPGPCGCECAGCDQMGMHCMKADRGCGWTRK